MLPIVIPSSRHDAKPFVGCSALSIMFYELLIQYAINSIGSSTFSEIESDKKKKYYPENYLAWKNSFEREMNNRIEIPKCKKKAKHKNNV